MNSNKSRRLRPAYTLSTALETLSEANRTALDWDGMEAAMAVTDSHTEGGEAPQVGPAMILGAIGIMAASGLCWEEIDRVIEATKERGLLNYGRGLEQQTAAGG